MLGRTTVNKFRIQLDWLAAVPFNSVIIWLYKNLRTLSLQAWLNLMGLKTALFSMGVIDKGILEETNICPFGSTLFQFPLCIFGWRFWWRECFTNTKCAIHLRVQSLDYKCKPRTLIEAHEHNYGGYQIIFHILKMLKYILKIRNLKIKISSWKLYIYIYLWLIDIGKSKLKCCLGGETFFKYRVSERERWENVSLMFRGVGVTDLVQTLVFVRWDHWGQGCRVASLRSQRSAVTLLILDMKSRDF